MGTISLKSPDSEKSQINRDDTTRTQLYRVNAVSQQDAEWSLYQYAPVTYQGLYKMSVRASTVLAGQQYDGEVDYGWPKKNQEVGTTWFDYDTTGGSKNLKNSLETISSGASPSPLITYVNAPDFSGLIGVSIEGDVSGVDVPSPSLKLSVHTIFDVADVTMEQVKQWSAQTGTMNGDQIWSFDPHELLFRGCTGSTKIESVSQPGVETIFQLEASENATDLTVGDMDGIVKDGWDYLWILTVKVKDTKTNMLLPKPAAYYVERVFAESTFGDLGIPDPDDGQAYSGPQFSE